MIPQSKREYLRNLVQEKNQWNRPLTEEEKAAGFLGWHSRGYLPHCDFAGLTQFVTFRLVDSMPLSRKKEWGQLLEIEDNREKRERLEEYLDRGLGECLLREHHIAKAAEEALLHFHESRYELLAWCVMPNHVHVLLNLWQTPLWKLVRSWKQFTANRAQAILAERRPPARRKVSGLPRKQTLQWLREYWDTFMRSESQDRTGIAYIENNPVKARLCTTPEQWAFSSARLRDEFRRLLILGRTSGGVSSEAEKSDDAPGAETGAPRRSA